MCNKFNFQEKCCKLVYCTYFIHNNIFLHVKYKHSITVCQIKTGRVDPAEMSQGRVDSSWAKMQIGRVDRLPKKFGLRQMICRLTNNLPFDKLTNDLSFHKLTNLSKDKFGFAEPKLEQN